MARPHEGSVRRTHHPPIALVLALLLVAFQLESLTVQPQPAAVVDPARALGGALDGHAVGDTRRLFRPALVDTMRQAGWHLFSVRLRTELAGDAWHWNPVGRWSDARHAQGYWTSADTVGKPIRTSFGYRLPRRGNTFDQANQDGWSRVDDGDARTFWKSNPYLAAPQWVVLDFGRLVPASAVRISWGRPRATRFAVETRDDYFDPARITDAGYWRPLSPGQPVRAVRIRLLEGERVDTADWRDGAGFAIREIQVLDGRGRDLVRHAPSAKRQTAVYVSSTDPWHRAVDRDPHVEQPGIDFLDSLRLGRELMLPVGVLYDTPENAAALLRYVRARQLPVSEIELGEEPEQQYVDPLDFATLYRLTADALRAVDPAVRLGGVSAVSGSARGDPDDYPARWMGALVRALRPGDLQFFTFEWYPFDDVCAPSAPLVAGHERTLRTALDLFVQAGVPRTIPWMITEIGFSPHASQAEVDLEGAITDAETIATFLAWGGARTYVYGTEPSDVMDAAGCTTGNLMLFAVDTLGRFDYHVPAFHAARLVSREWLGPEGAHALHDVTSPRAAVHAVAAHHPDGAWRMLVLNRSSTDTVTLAVDARWHTGLQYGRAQYAWGGRRPTRDRPPITITVPGRVTLPPMSITVLRD